MRDAKIDLSPTISSASVLSPNFPDLYCDDIDCNYNITAPEAYVIQLLIHRVHLEPNYDFLNFYDDSSNGLLRRWT